MILNKQMAPTSVNCRPQCKTFQLKVSIGLANFLILELEAAEVGAAPRQRSGVPAPGRKIERRSRSRSKNRAALQLQVEK